MSVARRTVDDINAKSNHLLTEILLRWKEIGLDDLPIDRRKGDKWLAEYPVTVCTAVQHGIEELIQSLLVGHNKISFWH